MPQISSAPRLGNEGSFDYFGEGVPVIQGARQIPVDAKLGRALDSRRPVNRAVSGEFPCVAV